ncbi:Peptide ABC transporter permease [Frankia canadensis]|uniref:Peptide ABC transporter permease n=1 Tax=Frankia canadensis TaxID=1836972 RepID=A0A2I2KQQ7_9ACTN|nr:ABC transporter permease [Frankia canadensis]SNQ48002.1 Peptide ABC transporter permease [Frankia canadensis]SOU55292.1 Peptide ABC transporter permease [Frankia canadensis]
MGAGAHLLGRVALRRVPQAVAVVWAAFTVTFLAVRVLPGDPVALMLTGSNGFSTPTPEQIAQARADLGFDRPLVVQYLHALADAAHGDFGSSIQTGRSVSSVITEALPSTLRLGATALLIALVLGCAVGLLANLAPAAFLRQVLRSVPAAGISLPSFWVGLMLLQLLSFRWHLFPTLAGGGPRELVLPACTLALPGAALVAQVVGRSLHDSLHRPWADTMRAAGIGPGRLLVGHGLRHAALPTLTVLGLLVGNLIGGAVVVETVFSRPGMGLIVQAAVGAQDLSVVQGVVVVAAVGYAITNLTVDLLYPVLDPRLRGGALVAAAQEGEAG